MQVMKSLAKLIACCLIAGLPILGYPAQASLCSEMSMAVSPSSESQISMSGMGDRTDGTKTPTVKMQMACQGGMGNLSCGMAYVPVPAYQVTAAITPLPVYRSVSHILIAQFVPEPPQRPPQTL
jgi:hypothetical protein